MATLPTLALDTYTNVNDTAIQGSNPVLEVIASTDDTDYVYDATNSTHTGIARFTIADMPSDFSSMSTIDVRLRYAWQTGTQVNTWDALQARVMSSDGATAYTFANSPTAITTTTITNTSVLSLGLTSSGSSASKADWDAALLEIRWGVTKLKSGDTLQKRVYAAELTGTYTAAAAAKSLVFRPNRHHSPHIFR